MLTLQAKEKEIENLTPEEEFIRGTVGAKCQINFDDFWQYYEKYVVFKRVGYEPINIMVDSLENEIEIPYTILAESGEFQVGVFGVTATETLPTLYSDYIKIRYGTDTHGTTPPKYEPNEIDQLRLSKQDKLTAGDGITIDENNVISATGGGGMDKVESWADVQNIVNLGMAQNVFKVGEQLECGHTKYGTLVWDITDVSPEKLSLCVHKCPVSLQFDEREALYYAETELAAGTYNFTIVTQQWYPADSGKTFQFTLTKPVPQGGQIVLDATHNSALAGRSVKTYSGGDSTTVIETATITEGSEGTAFGKTNGSVANVNHIQRAITGSNNYKESALRQWLNSDGAAGTFWTPQTVFDRPPSWETNTAGFINGLDADFLAVISDTTYDVGLNNVTDGGGKETLTDKFVLLSRDEIYAGSEGGVTQGEPLPYFSEFSDHNSPSTAADSNRIKTNTSGTATSWWLRSPVPADACVERYVNTSGALSYTDANKGHGVAPACNIIKNQ